MGYNYIAVFFSFLVEDQSNLQRQYLAGTNEAEHASQSKQRKCKTCKKPMKGHPKGGCQMQNPEHDIQ